MTSKIPTRKENQLINGGRRMSADVVTRNINGGAINHRRTSSIPIKSSKTNSTPPHSPSRSSRSAVLRDTNNVRSSSLEPEGSVQKATLSMLKPDNTQREKEDSRKEDQENNEEEGERTGSVLKLNPNTAATIQELLTLLVSSTPSLSPAPPPVALNKDISQCLESLLINRSQAPSQQEVTGSSSDIKMESSLLSSPRPPPSIVISNEEEEHDDTLKGHFTSISSQTDPPSPSPSPPLLSSVNLGTQTEFNGLQTQDSVCSIDSNVSSSHLQQRLEAMTISHELLQSSLDDARRQIGNLEATVERQRQEISSKETQLGVISGRVSTLMKSFETTQSDSLQYKTLYYRSLQQCTGLQEQLDLFNNLFLKFDSLMKLQSKVNGQASKNGACLEAWAAGLVNWESNYMQKKHELSLLTSNHESLQKSYQSLEETNGVLHDSVKQHQVSLAQQVVERVISSARERMREHELKNLEEILQKQKSENKEMQGKIAQLVDTFQRTQTEYMENAEFAEVERQMLLEANKELEGEVKHLKEELEKGEDEFKKLVSYTKDFQTKSTQKTEILKQNISKADSEIEELDRLLEQARKVLRDNESFISECEPLVSLLKELNGNNDQQK
ncbi:PREDICTED: early endosome antigen 1-like [Amphimedon queenslandica]|uniref:Uncharacterized protein n=1 Tax=Amphimedon queenslandica TaxID=400682 RepID=A0A1X7V1L0_AMPQE|nr:PREDICTED: early endosome antigen 1-like [Amphimedon queenslandica]|eukprot:XP_019851168.1 PREDICTED: early endosome antigen 1-like [Amphimedon queenslandica]